MQTQALMEHDSSRNIGTRGPGQTGACAGRPGMTTTVPREFVHRAAVAEVLLTGWKAALVPEARSERFVVRAQWPRAHSLFARSGGYQDVMLMVESVRQVGALLAHAEFAVPFGHQFMLRDIAVTASADLLRATPAPTEIELHTTCSEVVRHKAVLSGMRYDVTVLLGGVALGSASASFKCISPGVYRRLRRDRPTGTAQGPGVPIDPARVARHLPENVVLTEETTAARGRRSWGLCIDSTHPVFFDHPVDHVPGMVLLEAARQAAYALTGRPDALVTGISSTFSRYAELDAPCRIEAVPGASAAGGTSVRVTGVQSGQSVFTADVTLTAAER